MGIFGFGRPWYSSGLAFQCTQCGRCCSGPDEGYVWVDEQEMVDIAQFLGISPDQMRREHTRRVGGRHTIVERPTSNDCWFLVPNDQGGKGCMIYPVRPRQCRTWPFWPHNLSNPDAWALAQLRCPGINQGLLHPLDEIEAKRRTTGG